MSSGEDFSFHPSRVSNAQFVDDDVAQKLLDLGADPEDVERAEYVFPSLDVDTYRHRLFFENGGQTSFKRRRKRRNESAWFESGHHIETKRDHLNDLRERYGENSLPEAPDVPDEVYDPDRDWSEYRSYRCSYPWCRHQCINPIGSGPEEAERCWSCYQEHDTEGSRERRKRQRSHATTREKGGGDDE
ncbi:hypothetical protein [Natrinema versiforme]|uniref:Uncharacterized protein n=1 Tax=Natrinema versiforme JCM 10478 TaxID=1227496 RepID=L9XSV7_9EURY|nr:hypothetical protein [Natrinema versiforme]ELY64889.1 hypothetical protein C489_15781 [Natrinema versiforme JCM 10478]